MFDNVITNIPVYFYYYWMYIEADHRINRCYDTQILYGYAKLLISEIHAGIL